MENAEEELVPFYDEVCSFVMVKGKVAVDSDQDRRVVCYKRDARLVEQMEMSGIVSAPGHNGDRYV